MLIHQNSNNNWLLHFKIVNASTNNADFYVMHSRPITNSQKPKPQYVTICSHPQKEKKCKYNLEIEKTKRIQNNKNELTTNAVGTTEQTQTPRVYDPYSFSTQTHSPQFKFPDGKTFETATKTKLCLSICIHNTVAPRRKTARRELLLANFHQPKDSFSPT